MKLMTDSEIISNLIIDPIKPLGCSSRDPDRLKNLVEMQNVISKFVKRVISVASEKDSQEQSVRAIGESANDFLGRLSDSIGKCENLEDELERVNSKLEAEISKNSKLLDFVSDVSHGQLQIPSEARFSDYIQNRAIEILSEVKKGF